MRRGPCTFLQIILADSNYQGKLTVGEVNILCKEFTDVDSWEELSKITAYDLITYCDITDETKIDHILNVFKRHSRQ